MRQVTKDDFWAHVGNKDACASIENEYKYPYTVLLNMRHNRATIGKIVSAYTDGIDKRYPIVKTYFINN